MTKNPLTVPALIVSMVTVVAAAGCEADSGNGSTSSFVYAVAQDPVSLDPALVNDNDSVFANAQIYEGLVKLEPGGTKVVPSLATKWSTSPDGKTWTFDLRRDVTFQDGTTFDANAVCYNFDRWYNFKGALQGPNASLYWQTIFGGFADTVGKKSAPDELQKSLYKACTAERADRVTLELTAPSPSLLNALAIPAFGFASPAALKKYGANEGSAAEGGTFRATGTYGTEHPVGTGPFKLRSWDRGTALTFVRNPQYWGRKPPMKTIVIRPIADATARVQALQSGEVDGINAVDPQDVATIEGDDQLKLEKAPAFNVAFLGMTQSHAPLDDLTVRQAVAHAIDKKAIVQSIYGSLGVDADQFLPPVLPGAAAEVTQYPFDTQRAKELLQSSGVSLPVKLTFCYPSDVARLYLPDARRTYQAMAANLEDAGFAITPKAAPFSPDYLGLVLGGKCPLWLLGQTPQYADADAMFGAFFQGLPKMFAFDEPEFSALLERADHETDVNRRAAMYREASRMLMEFLPGVPFARATTARAFRANVEGYVPSPLGVDNLATVTKSAD